MKRFYIKSRAGRIEYFDVLSENMDGYKIRLTRLCDGNEKVSETIIARHLFTLCLKTGYIYEFGKIA